MKYEIYIIKYHIIKSMYLFASRILAKGQNVSTIHMRSISETAKGCG